MVREYVVKVTDALVLDAFKRFESEWAPEQELVRCKDCKFGEACKNGRGEHGVMCYNSHSASHSWVHEPDWFCADGERKEGRRKGNDSRIDKP